ncbi:unnamed protein product [Lepidochelys olivacea]
MFPRLAAARVTPGINPGLELQAPYSQNPAAGGCAVFVAGLSRAQQGLGHGPSKPTEGESQRGEKHVDENIPGSKGRILELRQLVVNYSERAWRGHGFPLPSAAPKAGKVLLKS